MTKKEKNAESSVQPVVNIGLVGHVDHGKSTLLKALSGKWTDTHSEEIKRGITIKLGYADATFYKCDIHKFSSKKMCEKCSELRTVSFVDAPGHETLMAVMLSGSAIMDGAILLVAANEQCPQPQTKEHLLALGVLNVKNIVIAQNKIDAVTKDDAIKNYEQIKSFVKGTIAENSPIIPLSAKYGVNINCLVEAIEENIKTPERNPGKNSVMFVARSFDINKPGTEIEKIHGGVFGGSLKEGVLKVGDEIDIGPGRLVHERGIDSWVPITTAIKGIFTGGHGVDSVSPGGSFAIETGLDPSIVKSDQLAGSLISLKGNLPKIWTELFLDIKFIDELTDQKANISPIKKGEPLVLNVNAMTTSGIVTSLEKKGVKIKLKRPVCAHAGSKVAASRLIGNRWHLVGWTLING